MKKKQFAFLTCSVLALCAMIALISIRSGIVRAGGPAVPVTINYATQVIDASSDSVKDQETSTMYVRSDGSTASLVQRRWTGPTSVGIGTFDRWLIIDAAQRSQISVYPALRMKTTLPIAAAQLEHSLLRSSTNCGSTTAVQDGEILGYSVLRLTSDEPDPARPHRLRTILWRAPALGCAQLRSVTELVDGATNAVIGKTVKQAVSVRLGSFDDSVFVVPPSFAEVSPSQTMAALAELKGKRCPECEQRTGAQADSNYFKRRQLAH